MRSSQSVRRARFPHASGVIGPPVGRIHDLVIQSLLEGKGELRKSLSRGTPPSKRGPHHGHGSSLLVAIADRSGISSPRLGSEGRVGSPRWRTCNHVARRSSKRRTLPLLRSNGWSKLNRCAWSVVRPRRFRRFEPHSSAREMSDHRSSTSSIPTLIRTNPGRIPDAIRTSSGMNM